MANVKKILENMTIREKIGQLSQYNANLFIDTDAAVTGDMQWLGISDEDLNYVGHVLNFKSSVEMRKIQEEHLKKDRNKIPMLFMMDVIHGFVQYIQYRWRLVARLIPIWSLNALRWRQRKLLQAVSRLHLHLWLTM